MNTATSDRATIANEYALPDALRLQLTEIYLSRLERLLDPEIAPDTELTPDEQRHLRNRAVLSAVRTITLLGEGPSASTLLRRAGPQ